MLVLARVCALARALHGAIARSHGHASVHSRALAWACKRVHECLRACARAYGVHTHVHAACIRTFAHACARAVCVCHGRCYLMSFCESACPCA
eukprot:3748920-Alexandrium_andersonii.AAC.1